MRLESVGIRYGRRGRWVLDGVTVDLPEGTVTAVVGGNGSGKSTLLRLVAGLTRPTTGAVHGRPERIGYVPERLPAGMRLSAHSYLCHMGRVQGLGTATAARRGRALLDELRLEGDPDAPIGTLSKGNAQKVALAQALLAEPRLLVLDEPWSGLDDRTHHSLADCLARRRDAGAIVLLTEHRPGVVAASADAVHEFRGGRLTRRDAVAPDSAVGTVDVASTAAENMAAGATAAGATATRTVTIVLGAAPDPYGVPGRGVAPLHTVPGVLAVRGHGPEVHMTVSADRSDAVLGEALRRGHPVLEVRRPRRPTATVPAPSAHALANTSNHAPDNASAHAVNDIARRTAGAPATAPEGGRR
ncbi:ATP-binding cassette domain-containing protein [Streptomyces sp. URMC 123]|uniref:ATP-binding cassette domain-containing protein n=1 Tax=Streptomyces sp. URMC 123 TaxID=3423403 RepID=UPI003F1ADEBC